MSNRHTIQPQAPKQISEYARLCLEALAAAGLGSKISLGGALGLMHYFEYRPTHDVDAWWLPATTGEERQRVITLLEATLRPHGQVQIQSWGDVTSVDLRRQGKTIFSFQIAQRSAQLEPC